MKIKITYLFSLLWLLSLTRCANVVTPTGGPKDTRPPQVVKAVPENRSTGFDGKKIEITFDEFITLENAQQKMLFSPPLAVKPDIKLSNKTVVIKFKESLIPNTTYTIHFGDAVKDLHEGNIFKDYTYCFSTGKVLDTLSIGGTVLDAEQKKPVEGLLVGVYADERDSLFDAPLHAGPDYLTMTDKEGKFTVQGLPDQKFLVFALKDMNSNLYYDMPNEMVAFLDTLVPASYPLPPQKATGVPENIIDTIPLDLDTVFVDNDTVFVDNDTLVPFADTLVAKSFDPKALDLTLYAFIEKDTSQMLLEKKLLEEGLLRFAFRNPADLVTIETPDPLVDSMQIIKIWSAEHDTLWWYFTPGVMDSLQIRIQYDTLVNDSTRYTLKYRESKSQGRQAKKTIKVSNNLKNNMLMPDEDLVLRFSEPIVSWQWHDTSTFTAGDSVWYNDMWFERMDEYGMEYCLNKEFIDTINYTVNIADSVFFSLRGRTNDSLSIRFKRALEKDLGNIFLTVVPPEDTQAVIQLLDSRNRVLSTVIIEKEQRVEFRQLLPEKYQLRAIIDRDRDGHWSTGNYHRRFQPETVVEFKDVMDLKAGWDIDLDEKWILFEK